MEMGSLAPGFQYASAKMASELNIFQQPSPNFGIRRGGVIPSIIVLHYTAMKSSKDAIERLSDPKSEVSAHYLIDEAGKVTQLVDEQKRAWHAGQGCWGEINDINSYSIGIELDYCPSTKCNFDERQISSLEKLLFDILKRRSEIRPEFIIAHSDMAPGRKFDPGMYFPWKKLSQKGLSIWPENVLDLAADWGKFKYHAERFGYRASCDTFGGWTDVLDVFRLRFLPKQEGKLSPVDMGVITYLSNNWPNIRNND